MHHCIIDDFCVRAFCLHAERCVTVPLPVKRITGGITGMLMSLFFFLRFVPGASLVESEDVPPRTLHHMKRRRDPCLTLTHFPFLRFTVRAFTFFAKTKAHYSTHVFFI
jgi:hypothetical protein